jgi:SAM-dependent methyltransferase
MDAYQQANRRRWDELAPLHYRSAFYDVASFKAGQLSLNPLELEELGDVAGRALLHLQCHFGLDTLSWARRGARVTGIDASPSAIDLARSLASETGVEARFVQATVEDLPSVLSETFDIVYTSHGAICWLPDLKPWARTIAHCLRPGGTFYMAENHPFADVFSDAATESELRVQYPYFPSPEPVAEEVSGSYADRSAALANRVSYTWSHSLSEIVMVLLEAGLQLEFLHEHPRCAYQRFPWMTRDADGWWSLPRDKGSLPLLFSLRAHKK